MNNSLVSVIIPVKDGERFLAEAIKSVLEQDYSPLEIILVDDGSTDGTAEIARSFEGIRYLYQTNQGHAAAMNLGLNTAMGEFIAFLDADDVWQHNKLKLQVAYLMDHPEVDYVLAKTRNFLEAGAELPPHATKDLSLTNAVLLSLGAMLARRAAFQVVGGFDVSYGHAKDVDWFIRAKEAGLRMAILPEVLLRRRLHGSNRSFRARARRLDLMRAVRSTIERRHAEERPQDRPARTDAQAIADDGNHSS
jgi:glycosyltransferase involved in cell wall biosynthesis